MKVDMISWLMTLGGLFGGIFLLKAKPDFIRGYEQIKDDPKKVRKLKRSMKFTGIWFCVLSSLILFAHIVQLIRILLWN